MLLIKMEQHIFIILEFNFIYEGCLFLFLEENGIFKLEIKKKI